MKIRLISAMLCLVVLISGCASNSKPVVAENTEAKSALDVMDLPVATATPTPVPAPTATPLPPAAKAPPASPASDDQETASTPEPTKKPEPAYGMKKINNEKGYIKAEDVNLRKGPGTDYAVVDKVDYPSKVVITAKNDLWYHIKVGDTQGYILKEYVGVGAVPTPMPTPKPTPKPTPEPVIDKGDNTDYEKDEAYIAAKLMYAEGKNQSEESYYAMASVLYNRCNSSRFGGTVEQEVYRSGQFSVVRNESFSDMIPSNEAYRIAQDVFMNGNRTIPEGVMYFRSASSGEYWSSSRTFYKTIGGNNYYY